jgi:regulator of protease activity HflC (stomatin/prohibitin superfamily)
MMMMNKNTYSIIFAALLFGILVNSIFVVNEKERAIVFQFGEAVRPDIPVGLHFKLPIIQDVKNMIQEFKHLMKSQIESLLLRVNIY